jgi:hypothetical protein
MPKRGNAYRRYPAWHPAISAAATALWLRADQTAPPFGLMDHPS